MENKNRDEIAQSIRNLTETPTEKVGLKIVDLLHDITQMDYQVRFCGDFTGMIRLEFLHEYDENFYEHHHLGCPDAPRIVLEKAIIKELEEFKKEKNNEAK